MREREQQVTSENSDGNYFDMIPLDLFMNQILSKLSVKSMGKCRCVSKLWSSILRPRNHNLLFPIKSSDQPRFLFAFPLTQNLVFFSVPQPLNPDENSTLLATRHHMKPITDFKSICPQSINGIVCSQHIRRDSTFALISTPITGQFVTTPILRKEFDSIVRYKFGYDPIQKHFKVLCLIWCCGTSNKLCVQHHVLTLETGAENFLWRKIQCCSLYYPLSDDGICINGVLYYTVETDHKKCMIVCFDVRYETFEFIIDLDQDFASHVFGKNLEEKIIRPLILTNYKGKLGVIDEGGRDEPLKMWVLEDAEECKWSKHVVNDKPYPWGSFAGMTDRGDIVFYPKITVENPFYISYYNLESKVMGRVRIEVPDYEVLSLSCSRLYPFLNYVEDVKLIL